MGEIIFDLGNKERNDVAKGKTQGMMESTEEIKPRASEWVTLDQLDAKMSRFKDAVKELKGMVNGQK